MLRHLGSLLRPAALSAGAALLITTPAVAQSGKDSDSALLRAFYETPAAQQTGWHRLKAWTSRLQKQRLPLRTGSELLALLRVQDSAIVEEERQSSYFALRASRDVRDAAAAGWSDSVAQLSGTVGAAVARAVRAVPEHTLRTWLRRSPALAAYSFALFDTRHAAIHLPPAEAELIQRLTPAISGWQSELYQQLIDGTDFGSVRQGSDTLDVWRQRSAIASSPDRAVRRAGYEKLYAGFARNRHLYAFALLHTVESRNRLARLQGERDAPAQVYHSRYLDVPRVRALLANVRSRAVLYRRYCELRLRFAQREGGFAEAGPWDLTASFGMEPPRFSIDSARSIMRLALTRLGPEYAAELDSLLDPAGGRLDLTGGEHRSPGGSSIGFPGTPVGVYLFGFEGYYTDLTRLVHESAHALHTRMIARGRVPPVEASGANYLAEAVALFNELVVADYLTRHATDSQSRQFYLERFLTKGFEVVLGAQDAELEQTIYDSVAAGRLATADDLDSLSTRVMANYSIWDPKSPERRERWIYARLLYNDPLYLVNYMYSGAIALSLFQQYQRDPIAFAPRYLRFLEGGYTAGPQELLRERLGVDLSDAGVLAADFELLRSRLAELERLQMENSRSKGNDHAPAAQ